jgi:hypothetical protein
MDQTGAVRSRQVNEQYVIYSRCASLTNAEVSLLKAAALYFDKFVIFDPVGASWDTVGADRPACEVAQKEKP